MSFNIWTDHLLCNFEQFVIIVGSHTRIWHELQGAGTFPTFNCSIPPSSISAWYTLGSFLWMTECIYVNCAWWKCYSIHLVDSHSAIKPTALSGMSFYKILAHKLSCYEGSLVLYKGIMKFQQHVLSGAFMHFLCIWLPISNYFPSWKKALRGRQNRTELCHLNSTY